ncbi:hypothetical protein BDZ89DRAFT_1149728 [Hymenopellis radicata]|nr:hypothetical protein BDZ89DRAFT_1149728 [Hymenopellis radicata]
MLHLFRDSSGRVPQVHQFTLENKRCIGYNLLSQRPTQMYTQKFLKLVERDSDSPIFDVSSVTKPEKLNPAAPWRVFFNAKADQAVWYRDFSRPVGALQLDKDEWVLPEKWVVQADEDLYQSLSLAKTMIDELPFPEGHPHPPALYSDALSAIFETRYGAEIAAGAYVPRDVVDQVEALRFKSHVKRGVLSTPLTDFRLINVKFWIASGVPFFAIWEDEMRSSGRWIRLDPDVLSKYGNKALANFDNNFQIDSSTVQYFEGWGHRPIDKDLTLIFRTVYNHDRVGKNTAGGKLVQFWAYDLIDYDQETQWEVIQLHDNWIKKLVAEQKPDLVNEIREIYRFHHGPREGEIIHARNNVQSSKPTAPVTSELPLP